MGTYYIIDNHDRKETIDLCELVNIKSGAFEAWSLQIAVLNTFLGFGWPRTGIDFNKWCGRWELQRIRIHGDFEDDADCDKWPDIAMVFLADLHLKKFGSETLLERWLRCQTIDEVGGRAGEYVKGVLNRWIAENPEALRIEGVIK